MKIRQAILQLSHAYRRTDAWTKRNLQFCERVWNEYVTHHRWNGHNQKCINLGSDHFLRNLNENYWKFITYVCSHLVYNHFSQKMNNILGLRTYKKTMWIQGLKGFVSCLLAAIPSWPHRPHSFRDKRLSVLWGRNWGTQTSLTGAGSARVTPGTMNFLLIDRWCSRDRGLYNVPIQRALRASTAHANRASSFYLLCTSSDRKQVYRLCRVRQGNLMISKLV